MGFLQNNVLTNIFIIIEQEKKFCFVYVHTVLAGVIKKREKKKFFFEKKTKTPSVMIDYIYSFSKKYSCTYIATLLDSNFQHIAIESDISRELSKTLEKENVSILIHSQWRVYCNLQDLNRLKDDFGSLALDFAFSPFAILYSLYKEASRGDNSIYILALSSCITMVIFKKSIVVSYINTSLLAFAEEGMDEEEGIEDLDGLDELGDDFDMQADVDDTSLELDLSYDGDDDDMSMDDDDNNVTTNGGTESTDEVEEEFKKELIHHMQSTINTFYESAYYKSDDDLIDSIVLFNDKIIASDLRAQIKEETMFDIFHKDVKFSDTVSSLMKNSIWY